MAWPPTRVMPGRYPFSQCPQSLSDTHMGSLPGLSLRFPEGSAFPPQRPTSPLLALLRVSKAKVLSEVWRCLCQTVVSRGPQSCPFSEMQSGRSMGFGLHPCPGPLWTFPAGRGAQPDSCCSPQLKPGSSRSYSTMISLRCNSSYPASVFLTLWILSISKELYFSRKSFCFFIKKPKASLGGFSQIRERTVPEKV